MPAYTIDAAELKPGDILRREQIKRPYKNTHLYDPRDVRVLGTRPGLSAASIFVDVEDLQDSYRTSVELYRTNRRAVERDV